MIEPGTECRFSPHAGYPADVIPLQYQAVMLADERRMTAFRDAVASVVTPGMRVLDLGAGTGVLSYFAARNGATVTAVEREPRVFAAARSALRAAFGDAVQVLLADARDYVPDEPVDVVLCEMLHVGLLRERQIEVIDGFKQRYRQRCLDTLPRFLPQACVQAVQPVEHDFTYFGYTVPAPVFQPPESLHPRTVEVAGPQIFQHFFYRDPLPKRCSGDLTFISTREATVNAIRIITRNVLAQTLEPPGSIDWTMNYLIVALPHPIQVTAGHEFQIQFSYRPGDEIHDLTDSLRAAS